ncbi:hypothetical protein PRIPAC_93540 [Pristionchus pacificus]|uniref:Uncharacterized protein n=1 Tax=Pristionchus pacificus TaxID=54126 RepID=A0A2A6BJ21_PRIPA|nr:hypothetical protein PRIPAC_93540 [Pristionchus pacificus]|eukprot:PDM65887.1 hypothetical protein PRIPAC_44166 [Pristionchus pacificus]
MDEVFPTSSTASTEVIVDDEYNIPRNVINPQVVKEVRDANRDSQRDSSIISSVPPTSSPTHRPLLLPTTKGSAKVPQITISLSPPTEETNGELVQRELFRSHKPVDKGWKGSTLIAALIALVILLALIFVLLLFQHI